jgi:CBS domain-containing protein
MTPDPACCRPDTPIRDVAQMMVTNDCGEVPVCDEARKPIGVVTDRDVVCRLVAKGHDPLHATASECMSRRIITCTPETSIEECAQRMESHQIRRMPVVEASEAICGMVSQADLARKAPRRVAAAIVEEVSKPNVFASAVGGR